MQKIRCFDSYGKEYAFAPEAYMDRHAVYGILIENNHIVLVKDSKASTWEFPGGGKEPAETDEQALTREFLEETGLSIQIIGEKLFEDIQYFYDITSQSPWKTTRTFYTIKRYTGRILEHGNTDDVSEAHWWSLQEISELNIRTHNRDILTRLIKTQLKP